MSWPLVLHTKGIYSILVLPLIDSSHLKAHLRLCKRPEHGIALSMNDGLIGLSFLLLDLLSVMDDAKLFPNDSKFENHTQQENYLLHVSLDWLLLLLLLLLLWLL